MTTLALGRGVQLPVKEAHLEGLVGHEQDADSLHEEEEGKECIDGAAASANVPHLRCKVAQHLIKTSDKHHTHNGNSNSSRVQSYTAMVANCGFTMVAMTLDQAS